MFTRFVLVVLFEELVTLSGEFLKTGLLYDGELDETTVQSWVRMECAGEQVRGTMPIHIPSAGG